MIVLGSWSVKCLSPSSLEVNFQNAKILIKKLGKSKFVNTYNQPRIYICGNVILDYINAT